MRSGWGKWVPVILLALYLPLTATWSSLGYQRLSAQHYRSVSNARGDKLTHERWLHEAGRNLERHRLGSLAVIDEKQPINSTPEFQYYSVGVYTLLAPLVVALGDVELSYLIGLFLFSAMLAAGVFLWTRRLSGSHLTATVLTGVVLTSPFLMTAVLDLYQFTALAALAAFALGTYLWLTFLIEGGAARLLTVAFLGTLFLLSHNLTVLLFTVFLAPVLLLQLWRETRGQPVGALRWAAVPVCLVTATAFYWLPILRDQAHLVITGGSEALLKAAFENFPLPELVFSPVSASPARSGTPLYPQVGWATLAAGLMLFTARNWLAYAIEAVLLLLATVNVWAWVPGPLHAVQFPFRVLICVPFLLLFQARPLKRWQTGLLAGVAVLGALLNLTRAPLSLQEVNHASFPPFFYGQYYRTDPPPRSMPSAGGSPAVSTRASIDLQTPLSGGATLAWSQELAPAEKAVSYRIHPIAGRANESVLGALILTYPDGERRQVGQYEFRADRDAFISTCAPGARRARLYLQSGSGAEMATTRFHIERIADDTYRYVASERGWHPVLCDYDWSPREQAWVFHVPPGASQQILPIFFSADNRLDAQAPKGGYLLWTSLHPPPMGIENAPVESFSVFPVRASGGDHWLRLNAGNHLKWLLPATFLGLLAWAAASLTGRRLYLRT